jgi:isopentenyldiphosphate isomerase
MRQVNLVNEADQIIGQTDLLDAHRGFGKKHQAISLFLFHKNKTAGFDLLLQQRSAAKIVGALQWANTLCANLIPGEDHLACLKRRVVEELGFAWQDSWYLKEVVVLDYQVKCENGFAENEIDHFFVGILDDSALAN